MSKKRTVVKAPWEVTPEMFLSEPEVDSLLKHVREQERSSPDELRIRATVDRLIIEVLLFSGLRNSELCHLRVIDTTVGHGKPALQVAETSKENRLVFIPSELSDRLIEFVKRVRVGCVAAEISPTDVSQPLILNERGRPYDRTALYRRVVRILSEAGLEDRASVQLLRHTCGYLSYKRTGGNLLFVQRQLGHAHPMVTAVYAQFVHFSDSDLANQVGREAFPTMSASGKRPRKKIQI